MNAKVGIRISACVTGLVIIGVLAILVPSSYWTLCSGVAAVLLGLSFVAPPFMPLPKPKAANRSDATSIWLIGPMSMWLAILAVVAAVALWLALHHVLTVAWAVMLLWAGLCIAGWASLRTSTSVVAHASAQARSASEDARTQWMAALNALSIQARETYSKNVLEELSERIRYAANDNASFAAPQNDQISSFLSKLDCSLDNSEELARIARSIEGLLAQREHAIRAARSFA